ncbi:MAG: hypothetical protein QM802_13965 [Agriterribacter sp.]
MATPKKKKAVKAAKKAPKKAAKVAKKKTVAPKSPVKKTPAPRPAALSRDAVAEANTENTTLDTLYIVNGSDNNITLEINVGAEEQTGDMTIKLDDAIIVENHAGDFHETIIGTNKSLNGKKLSIVANIVDTSRKTNFTSLSIHLKGGVTPNDFNLAKTVDDEGASVDYLCLIEFFKP